MMQWIDSSELRQWKYVDDLSIGGVRKSRAPSTMQNAVTELREWADENQLHLDTAKIQICFKRTPPEPPGLNRGTNTIDGVEKTKILGVWIQDDR